MTITEIKELESKITDRVIENRTKLVRDFLIGLDDLRVGTGARASGMNQGLKTVSTVRNAGCHASFNEVSNPVVLGGGFFPKPSEMKIAEKFWKWVTDKERSPWKSLMQNGIELVYHPEVKLPVGWILPHETVSSTRFQFQRNFCVLTRVFTEKHKNFIVWDQLISKGMEESDALYLCSHLTEKDGNYFICANSNLSGAHWPITDFFYKDDYYKKETSKKLDFNAFRTGEIIDNDTVPGTKGYYTGFAREMINGYFQEVTPSNRSIFDVKTRCTLSTQKGSFSSQSFYKLDNVIDEFYKWQDEEGLLRG